ncbi:MAG: peroxiredoxin [Candidatus Nezhaarchaeota archaeon]|nr:peroxiredoxin [Candidatus Nezhaarchaeota archaeon]
MPISSPSIGEKFPEMLVETTHGPVRLPGDYAGKWFVLFSHPADFTPVCTTEFVAFALRHEEFKRLNVELIGLSVDQSYSHIKWVEWIEKTLKVKIPFPIIADPAGQVSQALGMLHAQSGTRTVRAVFIVDPNGIIRAVLYYPLELGRNINEILRMIKALQVGGAMKRAVPANWPENEVIGSSVIVPPASTVAEAEDRPKKFKCFDWWFCYDEAVKPEDVEEAKKLLYLKKGLPK